MMKTIDRIIFGTIAVALMFMALQPYIVNATGHRDHVQRVNIIAVGGYAISGPAMPTKWTLPKKEKKKWSR